MDRLGNLEVGWQKEHEQNIKVSRHTLDGLNKKRRRGRNSKKNFEFPHFGAATSNMQA